MITKTHQPTSMFAIVSLHFSPAFISHMIAYAKLARNIGFDTCFLLEDEYLSFREFSAVGQVIAARDFFSGQPLRVDFAVICNSSRLNPLLASRLRDRGAAIIYVHHEPLSVWDWNSLRLEGWRQIVRFPISAYFSARTLRRSSAVLVPSDRARVEYEKNYRKLNSNVHVLPLLFDAEISSEQVELARGRKTCFGFIGSASRGHGFDWFVAFAKYAIRSGSNIQFVIATRRCLRKLLQDDRELAMYAQEGKIRIEHGRVMSNQEINEHYLNSFCVWNVYRRSTQSGVLPRAFMAGTPVLARRIGSFPEFVQEGLTGEFVDSPGDLTSILEVVEKLRGGVAEYIENCRTKFLETFHYEANVGKLSAILESIRQGNEIGIPSDGSNNPIIGKPTECH